MEMHLPGGSSLFDVLFETPSSVLPGPAADVTTAPTPELLEHALALLHQGDLEYITLVGDDGTFQQVAGAGEGPYQLERRPVDGDGPVLHPAVPPGYDTVRRAMHAYLTGGAEPDDLTWVPGGPPPEKKGWFGRRSRRG